MANKGGRPRTEINWAEFDKLCALQATLREIASWFECTEDTIERAVQREHQTSFAAYFAQKRAKGLTSLRRKQFEVAMQGDRTMLIWLGKQYLEQRDKQEIAGAGGGPIQTQDVGTSDTERAERAEVLLRRAAMRKRGVS